MTDTEMAQLYPSIPWRKAILCSSTEAPEISYFGCRFCLARSGLLGADLVEAVHGGELPVSLFRLRDAFDEHMTNKHPAAS